jgi:three-Cys-motif partner protein
MSVIDEVGIWTQMKLEIIRKYASAYTNIMKSQPYFKEYAYIDGFAGAGENISKETGETIEGSPSIALGLPNKFTRYHFIDLDGKRIAFLERLKEGNSNVTVWHGDGNDILLNRIFPEYPYKSFKRALCLLDPYNLNPVWEVVRTAGELGTIDIFLNFMIMDANRKILLSDPQQAPPEQKKRMTDFWGDESWRTVAYHNAGPDLFRRPRLIKASNETIIGAYRDRLMNKARFKYVPEPLPMRNSKGSTIYYLFFASQNGAGNGIATSILNKYRN